MCQLIIHTAPAPKHPTDALINAGQYQPGDVVSIIEDGEQWGALDEGPHNITMKLTGTLKADVEHLLSCHADVKTVLGKGGFASIVSTPLAIRMWNAKDINQLKMLSGVLSVPKGQEVVFTNTYFNKSTLVAAVDAAQNVGG